MLKSAFVFCVAVLGMTALASEAYRNSENEIQISQIISGKTVFERRTTVVPMALCTAEPCRKPEVYWSLVIYNETTRYEVSQVFGLGSRTPPSRISIAGAQIREGTVIEVEGKVNPISSEYAIVTDISRAEVLEDPEAISSSSEIMPDGYSWMCQSPAGNSPRIYANVRYLRDREDPRPTDQKYYMAISMAKNPDGLSYLPIAEIENVRSYVENHQVTYIGGDQRMTVELRIDKSLDRMFDLPSKLVLSKTGRAVTAVTAPAGDDDTKQSYPLSCTRTRLN